VPSLLPYDLQAWLRDGIAAAPHHSDLIPPLLETTMDKTVLNIDLLTVESFTVSAASQDVVGDVETGCVSGCATGCGFGDIC
jgi:hypothetical protein